MVCVCGSEGRRERGVEKGGYAVLVRRFDPRARQQNFVLVFMILSLFSFSVFFFVFSFCFS